MAGFLRRRGCHLPSADKEKTCWQPQQSGYFELLSCNAEQSPNLSSTAEQSRKPPRQQVSWMLVLAIEMCRRFRSDPGD
jgi:hypothetical protein